MSTRQLYTIYGNLSTPFPIVHNYLNFEVIYGISHTLTEVTESAATSAAFPSKKENGRRFTDPFS